MPRFTIQVHYPGFAKGAKVDPGGEFLLERYFVGTIVAVDVPEDDELALTVDVAEEDVARFKLGTGVDDVRGLSIGEGPSRPAV